MRSDQNINVSWQAGILIFALVFIPVVLIPVFSGAPRQVVDFCELLSLGLFVLALLAVASKVFAPANRGRQAIMLKQTGIALGLLAVALALTLVSINFGTFSAFGQAFFIAPTGLYIAGLATLAKAFS